MSKTFWIWRFIVTAALAKSGTWTTTASNKQYVHLFSIGIVRRDDNQAFNIIIGPGSLLIGYVS